MNTSNDQIIRLAQSYAVVAGRHEPNGHDFMTAAVAAGVPAANVRTTAEVAMTVWGNANPAGGTGPTLAQRAAAPGRSGRRARTLLRSGRYTGAETIGNQSGRWELP